MKFGVKNTATLQLLKFLSFLHLKNYLSEKSNTFSLYTRKNSLIEKHKKTIFLLKKKQFHNKTAKTTFFTCFIFIILSRFLIECTTSMFLLFIYLFKLDSYLYLKVLLLSK
ncbi:hypothetical protein BpHYR1_025093 [Brachionus plicatilis]|uniref:Uncharacterized protein n=1 Tax=Brachionus plicatilis TaxID=10195 RepID=A0A3M7RGT2_BRAPC|nr:hypothetical protein BpHYR1_025093 [Brachionus plicatilis]